MVRKFHRENGSDDAISGTDAGSILSAFSAKEDFDETHEGDVSSEDTFQDFSVGNDDTTPNSLTPSLSLRRSSAYKRKSNPTRSSYEGSSSYYNDSDGSSICQESSSRPTHLSFPTDSSQRSEWDTGLTGIRRTMSVPVAISAADADDADVYIPAPLSINRRKYSLEDPPSAPSDHACIGSVNDEVYANNALLHGLDSNVNQLQVYLLGTEVKKIPPTMDLPASYVVFLPGHSQNESSNASPTIARYRCRYPQCEVKWRDEDEHKIHQLEHVRVHLQCQVPQCSHSGFDNNIDLIRHLQTAHEHVHHGPFKGYACAAEVCPKKDKVWLKADTFRSHCDQAHSEEDREDLVERSRISLGYLDYEAAVKLCQLRPEARLYR